jgi:hypothetical protein
MHVHVFYVVWERGLERLGGELSAPYEQTAESHKENHPLVP